jgi:hypothetical protein
MGILCSSAVFAQKTDTSKITFKPKPKVVSRVPAIKANIQPYKSGIINFGTPSTTPSSSKSTKILTVLKVYPNPVVEQLNINLRLEKETTLTIIISDALGNEVVTLTNGRSPAGEQTKTFSIPTKLNPGIYYLKIIAGGEPKAMKISVL